MITKCFDAATPPQTAPAGCTAVLGYAGGARATRSWTLAEWRRFSHLRQFPAWVPALGSNPLDEALHAVSVVKELGWSPHMPEPYTRVIVGDLETGHDAAWWQQFANTIGSGGYVAVAYGSLSTILANAAVDVWAADYDNVPELLPGQTIHATQYQADVPFGGTQVDYSVIDEWLLNRGGVGPRHG